VCSKSRCPAASLHSSKLIESKHYHSAFQYLDKMIPWGQ
jgi:hypothetical protein